MKRLTYDLLICTINLPQAIQLEYFISMRRVNTKVKGVDIVTFKLLQNVNFTVPHLHVLAHIEIHTSNIITQSWLHFILTYRSDFVDCHQNLHQ